MIAEGARHLDQDLDEVPVRFVEPSGQLRDATRFDVVVRRPVTERRDPKFLVEAVDF
ncbi:MAG: hypothetical protein AAF531_25425 [Actinomycetota bacterium]